MRFVFFGGVLTLRQIQSIKLPVDEINEYKFLELSSALSVIKPVRPELTKRIGKCLKALKTNSAFYLENGEEVN